MGFKDNPSEAPEHHPHEDVLSYDDVASTKIATTTSRRRKWYLGIGVTIVVVTILSVVIATTRSSSASVTSAADIENILKSASETGGTEFNDITSYQSKAMQWLQNNLVNGGRDRLLQRYALACIYYSTYQVRNEWLEQNAEETLFPWKQSKGWMLYDNECDWIGVDCNEQGLVTDLNLGGNNLSGEFPDEVRHLANSLRLLDIEGNYFYNKGEQGTAWLGKLSNLQYLYMKDTMVQNNGLPKSFGHLTALEELDCSYSLLHGPLHAEIFENTKALRYMDISGNSIQGPIPTSITALPSLKYFYATNCDLQQTNLNFLLGMPSLVETWLDRNPQLTGTIPPQLGQTVPTLQSLSVTRCGLTGTIPTELGLLTNMQQMWLYRNQLKGRIPTELGHLAQITTFAVEGNQVTGNMPDQVCALTQDGGLLETLHADCNEKVRCSCCDCCGPTCSEG